MATLTPPSVRSRNLGDYQRRMRSPLARLRGYIRAYVSLEGALLLVLYLALWFWIGLSLDYGFFFKLTGIDWVQEWPWAVRLVLLVLVASAILSAVSFKMLGRLLREFRDAALALVLERRFPKQLGDRLITAVELSDLREAEKQGYSPAMVLETIHEAAERVEQVPVKEAFNWGRLVRRAAVVGALTLVLYIVVAALFLRPLSLLVAVPLVLCLLLLPLVLRTRSTFVKVIWTVLFVALPIVSLALGSLQFFASGGHTGFRDFNETAQIWFERNILLRDTIWPRQAQLQFVNFPEREWHIGRDNKVPPIRLRALEYVVADPAAPEGWRALGWDDLSTPPPGMTAEQLGGPAPRPPFTMTPPRDDQAGLTVDEVALQLRKFDVRTVAAGPDGAKWQVADAAAPGGWRPLLWSELKAEKLDGLNPPAPDAGWTPKNADLGLTVDDVAAAVAAGDHNPDADAVLQHLDSLAAVHDALDRINGRAALPEMSRKMRRLDVPETVYLYASGEKSSLRNELHRSQDNEYTGNFGDLKESVAFSVQADDYWTPRRFITLVAPPSLTALDVEEGRPAYLFYWPDDATPLSYLRGKKQPFQKRDVLQAGSETSRIDVPAGADLVLTARSDKPLREVYLKAAKNVDVLTIAIDPAQLGVDNGAVQFRGAAPTALVEGIVVQTAAQAGGEPHARVVTPAQFRTENGEVRFVGVNEDLIPGAPAYVTLRQDKEGNPIHLPLEILSGGKDFRVALPDVRRDTVFEFEFTDTDGVKGKRKVVLKPQDDTAPELTDVAVPFIRKATLQLTQKETKEAAEPLLMVTRKARIPLEGKVHDDHMLGDIRYRYTLVTSVKSDVNAIFMVPSLPLAAPAGGLGAFQSAAFLLAQDRGEAQTYVPPQFALTVQNAHNAMPHLQIEDMLRQPQLPPFRQLVHDVEIKPDDILVSAAHGDKRERNAQDPENTLGWDFPLWTLPQLQNLDDNHSPYRLDLYLEASDTDADEPLGRDGHIQPHLSKSKETFSFWIVPENTLLTKIGEDQAKQYALLNQRYQTLKEKAETITKNVADLQLANAKISDVIATSVRAQQANETVDNTLATTQDVFRAYSRIEREEQLNVVEMRKITDMEDHILNPLHDIIDLDFPPVQEATAKFRKTLDDKSLSDKERIDASVAAGKDLSDKMTTLLTDLDAVLASMKGTVNLELLTQHLEEIAAGVQHQADVAAAIKVKLENDFFDKPK